MLEILKRVLQSVLIWLLLFINGGKLPPELLPPINIPDFDWSSLMGQTSPWQLQVPSSLDDAGSALAARKPQVARQSTLPEAGQTAQEADLLPAALGTAGDLAAGNPALLGAMAGGMSNIAAAIDPSAPIVNPSGVPRELLGAVYPWRTKGSGRPGTAVTTEIVEPAAQGSSRATLALILLGAGALAVAGYVVTRRRR